MAVFFIYFGQSNRLYKVVMTAWGLRVRSGRGAKTAKNEGNVALWEQEVQTETYLYACLLLLP